MRGLNKKYRGKDYATDILSFPLEKNVGEIFICKEAALPKSRDFGRAFDNYLSYLFIHGLCHLKGMTHGATMERQERKIRKQFGV
jgi:probable rRNA maturation factor